MTEQSDCPFCKIALKHYSVYEVYRDDQIVAFLDRGPIRPGHLQIVPLEHYAYFDDLPPELAAKVVQLGQHLAKVQKQITGVDRVAFLFTGGDIPHAHAHLVPMHDKADITSRRYIVEEDLTFEPRPRATHDEQTAMAAKLMSALGTTGSKCRQ
ncbi:histidine triad protein [Pseudovibrio japonicus]|uniref:Histidine triad protein n=1 Tax=Pseudovibrio japonicus TaxID=366534 RepID=A0ABQ3EBP5_9HYPH|nr:HIT family protein [Pseudovibrio japonicus]GHB29661.1 histidine triad protein [Pseudovibrio japonicus]